MNRFSTLARLLLVIGVVLLHSPAEAAPPEPQPPAATEASAPATPPAAAETDLAGRALAIVELMQGTLDPSVDARALLRLDLADPSFGVHGERIAAVLAAAQARRQKEGEEKAAAAVPVLEGLEPPAAFKAAYVAYLSLPAADREALIADHEEKQAAQKSDAEREQQEASRLEALQTLASQLQAYLRGELDVAVDPASLLQLDLGRPEEAVVTPRRSLGWGAPPPAPDPKGDAALEPVTPTQDPTTPAEPEGALAPTESELLRVDELRRQFLALSPEQRTGLAAKHTERAAAAPAAAAAAADAAAAAALLLEEVPADSEEEERTAQVISDAETAAESAAKARLAALEAAKQATTQAKRILAEERARLLGVKEEQALFEADVNRRKAIRTENHDKALEWVRRVNELEKSPMFAAEKAAEADPLYDAIRSDLGEMRQSLRDELDRIRAAGSLVPTVGQGLDGVLTSDVDRGAILDLRTELSANESTLAELERTVGWELAQGLRDDVVLLNRTRLALLEISSSSLRASVTGFGSAGVDQVQRELDQISVELGFNALKLPRYRKDIAQKLRQSGVVLLLGTVQFLFALGIYLWWRRQGGALLLRLEQLLRNRRPSSRLTSGGATLVWYLQRIRRPLELLLVLWVLFALIGSLDDLPEFNLIWIVALWVLLGLAVIQFVDALAAQETLYSSDSQDNSALRIHSLRVVGLNVIAVGLILSLTSAIVGKGAIHSWVISTCWVLSFPVAVYLVHKWKPIIFPKIAQRTQQGPFTKWVTSKKDGVASFFAAAAAAVYLIGAGLGSWLMRQLSGLEATRRLLAYLFRREVAKQAAATEADGRFTPVSPEIYAAFNPEVIPGELLERVAGAEVDRVAEMVATPRPTLSAVVGERGSGKSVFVRQVAAKVGPGKVCIVTCPEEGFEALLAEIANNIDKPELRGSELASALGSMGPMLVIVDDLQRLVVPAVDGLQGLDAFTAFARQVGGQVSWVVTIGSASWHYVKRARGERVFFEQVVHVPHWSEDQLGELIRGQCAVAKIEPSFEGLVVPRQAEAPLSGEGNRSEAGYHRLLWDFSKGNPAVALHAFRESLFVTPEGKIVVRLFKEPSPEEIEDLSMSVLFVLRTIIQLELAVPWEVVSATQLPSDDVDDALRFALARGYIESFHDGVRIAWPWYRTITIVLNRQHLLSAL